MHNINLKKFYYDRVHGNMKKTRLQCKIYPAQN
jgi:hypothetical protein